MGVLSATINWNTEKASSTVTPSDTFSPDSGGSQKTISEMIIQYIQGVTMLMKKYLGFRDKKISKVIFWKSFTVWVSSV